MTTNQIRYQEHLETKRHNAKSESQIDVQNAETGRHNLVTESETARHNRADESIRNDANAINAAHYARMDSETERHNRSTESESFRHNVSSEDISRYAAGAGYAGAAASRYAAGLNYALGMSNLDENIRHNIINEAQGYSENQIKRTQADASLLQATSSADLRHAQSDTEYYKQSLMEQQTHTQSLNQLTGFTKALSDVVNTGVLLLNTSRGGR